MMIRVLCHYRGFERTIENGVATVVVKHTFMERAEGNKTPNGQSQQQR